MTDDNLINEGDNFGERIDLDTYSGGLVHELTGTETGLRPFYLES